MKKHGFTLAEVLITLGIIGVISALTMPTFTAKTQSAKVGPILAKAKATFEQASGQVLSEASSDSILGAQVCENGSSNCASRVALTNSNDSFWNNYKHFMKGSQSGATFTTADGVSYTLGAFNTSATGVYPGEVIITSLSGSSSDPGGVFMIDINGSAAPNRDAKDRFYFTMWDDGTLKPVGGANWSNAQVGFNTRWSSDSRCQSGKTPDAPKYCAGHIFENNLKVEYK